MGAAALSPGIIRFFRAIGLFSFHLLDKFAQHVDASFDGASERGCFIHMWKGADTGLIIVALLGCREHGIKVNSAEFLDKPPSFLILGFLDD